MMNELADEKTIRRTALIARAEHTAEDILQLDDDVHGSVGVFIYELCQNNYENKRLYHEYSGKFYRRQGRR